MLIRWLKTAAAFRNFSALRSERLLPVNENESEILLEIAVAV